MRIAFSPCPNDTFIFHAWVHQLLPHAPRLDVTYADIDITNQLAIDGNGPDILKVSCAVLPFIHPEYALVPCGGALGNGCGPLILARNGSAFIEKPFQLAGKKVAIPSERSTAYLLFRLWAEKNVPESVDIHTLPFNEIMSAIQDGVVEAGLVIHEARFTYPSFNLTCIADLGVWWEEETHLPLPLGAIIARRSLDLALITQCIRGSLSYAWKNPSHSGEYIKKHAQEMDAHVIREHIHLYVNSYSYELGEKGNLAISTLLTKI